ncbi:fumarate hydratase [Chloroflexota bacterium]
MREVNAKQVADTVSRLFSDANFYLTDDVLDALKKASRSEESPIAREILGQILENAKIAAMVPGLVE